nr:DNA Repair ATPase [Escherichia coli]
MRKEISRRVERAVAYSVNFRTAERFGLIEVTEKPVVFWFEIHQATAQ